MQNSSFKVGQIKILPKQRIFFLSFGDFLSVVSSSKQFNDTYKNLYWKDFLKQPNNSKTAFLA